MMQISRRTFLAGAAVAAFGLHNVAAQDDQEDAGQLLRMVPGIDTAYARKYVPASSIPVATPAVEQTAATPDYLLAMMITFESEAAATGVIAQMLNADIAGMIMHRDPATLESATNADLPDGNTLFFGEDESAVHPYASLLVVPLGELVVLLNATGGNAEIQPTVDSIADYISGQERGSEPVSVVNRGNAEGDVFEMLPDVEDMDMLNGLAPVFDYDLLESEQPIEPPGSATPEASPAHDHGH